jgi:hypothetical protein
MNTTLQLVTPQWAADVLADQNTHNRKLRKSWVDKLTRDINAGAFITTHQGIAFDENGTLLDGQHRLAAIVQANRPVNMLVTEGIKARHRVNGTHISAFDAIDQGAKRGADEILRMCGHANYARLAGVCRGVIICCSSPKNTAISPAQIQLVLSYIAESAEACMAASPSTALYRPTAAVVATCVILHQVYPSQVEQFVQELVTITGNKTSPSRALVSWVKRHPQMGGTNSFSTVRATAAALECHIKKISRQRIQPLAESQEWLLAQNPELVKKVHRLLGQ